MPYTANELLSRLIGFRLYSVQFVMDYVQLRFDAANHADMPVLNCDVWPEVRNSETAYRIGDLGYADALRSLIPQEVVATAEATGLGLSIEFTSGAMIIIHPSPNDLAGPEIAMLSGFEDGRWMAWRPGEDSFEHLG